MISCDITNYVNKGTRPVILLESKCGQELSLTRYNYLMVKTNFPHMASTNLEGKQISCWMKMSLLSRLNYLTCHGELQVPNQGFNILYIKR